MTYEVILKHANRKIENRSTSIFVEKIHFIILEWNNSSSVQKTVHISTNNVCLSILQKSKSQKINNIGTIDILPNTESIRSIATKLQNNTQEGSFHIHCGDYDYHIVIRPIYVISLKSQYFHNMHGTFMLQNNDVYNATFIIDTSYCQIQNVENQSIYTTIQVPPSSSQ